jgi:hypothetical protein
VAKVIDKDTPLEERLRSMGIDYDFMRFLLHWCGVLSSKRKPITDKRFQKWFGKKTVKFHQTLFLGEPFLNPPSRPSKDSRWIAVSYLHDYFRAITKNPHWRLIEEFLQSVKVWGKSSLKSEWLKKGKKMIKVYDSESYRPNVNDLLKFYDCHKGHLLIAMNIPDMNITNAAFSESEKPIFWSVKLVYSG